MDLTTRLQQVEDLANNIVCRHSNMAGWISHTVLSDPAGNAAAVAFLNLITFKGLDPANTADWDLSTFSREDTLIVIHYLNTVAPLIEQAIRTWHPDNNPLDTAV
jgi:hypothetical protein